MYQQEGEVVIIVPPLSASLDDNDQDQGSPKTTESTSEQNYIKYSAKFIFLNLIAQMHTYYDYSYNIPINKMD